jgi:hypothetical protein
MIQMPNGCVSRKAYLEQNWKKKKIKPEQDIYLCVGEGQVKTWREKK